jgi:glucokinase
MLLTLLITGGVYIAGGIVPRLMARVQKTGVLLNSFLNKAGRPQFHEILKTVPLYVVTNTKVGLLGSREYALRLADESK